MQRIRMRVRISMQDTEPKTLQLSADQFLHPSGLVRLSMYEKKQKNDLSSRPIKVYPLVNRSYYHYETFEHSVLLGSFSSLFLLLIPHFLPLVSSSLQSRR